MDSNREEEKKKKSVVYENADIFLNRKSSHDPFDEEFERELKDAPKLPVRSSRPASALSRQSSSTSTSSSSTYVAMKRQAYDEISLNAGRPVILSSSSLVEGNNRPSLTNVQFESPLNEINTESIVPKNPVPAPRFSKLKQTDKMDEENEDEKLYEVLVPKHLPRSSCSSADSIHSSRPRPEVAPRLSVMNQSLEVQNLSTRQENLYSEVKNIAPESSSDNVSKSEQLNLLDKDDEFMGKEVDECDEEECNKRSILDPRLTTLDIRKDVNKLWEKAVQELDRDKSLVEFFEQREDGERQRKVSSEYDHVAIPDQKFKIINGVQVPIPATLLKNFDPCFEVLEERSNEEKNPTGNDIKEEQTSSSSSSSSSESSSSSSITSSPTSSPVLNRSVTIFDRYQSHSTNSDDNSGKTDRRSTTTTISSSSYDPPPPSEPPPPTPKRPTYENVWVPPSPTGQSSEASSNHSSLSRPLGSTHSKDSAQFSATPPPRRCSGDQSSDTALPNEVAASPAHSVEERESEMLPKYVNRKSSSTSNLSFLTKKLSFTKLGIGRKVADQNPGRTIGTMIKYSSESSDPPSSLSFSQRRKSSLVETQNHSGLLRIFSKQRKNQVQEKWCVLSEGKFSYFDSRDSLLDPKEVIFVKDILSLNKSYNDEVFESERLYCFDLAFVLSKDRKSIGTANKFSVRTFGSLTPFVRDAWVEKLALSLSFNLNSLKLKEISKLGWVNIKEMFAGEWNSSWIGLSGRNLMYAVEEANIETVDMKLVRNITLVKTIKNLNAPDTTPVLVVDFVDRSLYLQARHEKEIMHWQSAFENVAFNNGSVLSEQQLTKDGLPVIVEQCINFVFRHGCLTEGIYRHSGVKTKIDRLLSEFRNNAWDVAMTRDEYTEHDVANALKRFMRTLDEPLLTRRLAKEWVEASKLSEQLAKIEKYSDLLSYLPTVNYKTLRRLIGHLRTIANQCDKNLMPNYNLAAIWGTNLIHVDSDEASTFAHTSGESDICRDLIDYYPELFDVSENEIRREEELVRKTENFSRNPNPVKISGEVMMFVHIDTKSSGDCVSIAVTPKMTAEDLRGLALRKSNYSGDATDFILHEVVLGGQLERPIHYKEIIYEVTLKWWQWSEEDRRETYLLLKKNVLWEESLAYAVTPFSAIGEGYFGDNARGSKSVFKKYQFSMNNARLTRSKAQKNGNTVEMDSWDIEKIIWFFGCEASRSAPYHFNITFIEKDMTVSRSKDRPFFGKTISFADRELFLKWVAAMLVAEHQNDLKPAVRLLNIDEE